MSSPRWLLNHHTSSSCPCSSSSHESRQSVCSGGKGSKRRFQQRWYTWNELLCATRHDNRLYLIDHASSGQDGGAVYYATSSGSLHLWHWHLGHLHLDAVCSLASKNLVKGLTISLLNMITFVKDVPLAKCFAHHFQNSAPLHERKWNSLLSI